MRLYNKTIVGKNSNNIRNTFYVGNVVSNDDPENKGRVKVVVHGLTGGIPYSQLPFYSIILQGNNYFIPTNGSMVLVLFMDDSISNGIVIGAISNKKFPNGFSLYNQGIQSVADITIGSANYSVNAGNINNGFTNLNYKGNSINLEGAGGSIKIDDNFNVKSPRTIIDSPNVKFNSSMVSTNIPPEGFNVVSFLSSRFQFISTLADVAEKTEETKKLIGRHRSKIDQLSRLYEGGSEEKSNFETLGGMSMPSVIYPSKEGNNSVTMIDYEPFDHAPEATYKEKYDFHWGNILAEGRRTSFDLTTKLSDNFTVGDMTTGNSFPYVLQPNLGLQEFDILNNLCYLCNYVLEDINTVFKTMGSPGNQSMRVNSGFRFHQNNSQHNIGQAVDVQFTRNNYVEDYYDETIKKMAKTVNFDQFIVEYSYGKYPTIWLHISYNKDLGYAEQRNDVLTYKSWNGIYSKGILKI